jgi:hypothetical protein
MPAYPNDSECFQQEDYLFSLITAQTGAGGLLAGVANVEKATPPESNLFPQVGLTFDRWTGDVVGQGPTYQRDAYFTLTAAVKQPFNPASPDTAQAARLALRQYVDNGSGLGLLPLLKTNYGLGGLAQVTWVSGLEIVVYKTKSATAAQIAMAVVTFRTRYRTR